MNLRKLRAVKTIQRHGRAYIHMERVLKDIDKSLKSAIENKLQGLSEEITPDDISQQPKYMYFDKELREDYQSVANEVWSDDFKRSRDNSSLKFSGVTKRWVPPTDFNQFYIEKNMDKEEYQVKETELRDGTFTINSEFSNFFIKSFAAWRNHEPMKQLIKDYKGGEHFSELGPIFEETITNLDKNGKYTIIQNKTPSTIKLSHKHFVIDLYQKYLEFQISLIA